MSLAEQELPPIFVNGLVVDPATGEIVGVELDHTEHALGHDEQHRDGRFHVINEATAEWVLQRLFEAETECAALEARKRLYVANIRSMQADLDRRIDFFRNRFSDELQQYAKTTLEGARSRTLKTPWARMSFRKRAARRVVDDEQAALEWAKTSAPAAVKVTTKLLVSELPVESFVPGTHVEAEYDAFKVETGAGE